MPQAMIGVRRSSGRYGSIRDSSADSNSSGESRPMPSAEDRPAICVPPGPNAQALKCVVPQSTAIHRVA